MWPTVRTYALVNGLAATTSSKRALQESLLSSPVPGKVDESPVDRLIASQELSQRPDENPAARSRESSALAASPEYLELPQRSKPVQEEHADVSALQQSSQSPRSDIGTGTRLRMSPPEPNEDVGHMEVDGFRAGPPVIVMSCSDDGSTSDHDASG